MEKLNYSDFEKIELRIGKIVNVEDFERTKKPAFKVYVDFGSEIGIKKTSAQITKNYKKEDLINKLVIGCLNLGEKNIAGFISDFLLTGFPDKDGNVILAIPEKDVPLGSKLF